MNNKNFEEAINVLPQRLRNILLYVSDDVKNNTYEIRLRINKPIVLFGGFGCNFVNGDSTVTGINSRYAAFVNKDELNQTVNSICGFSVYTHQNDIAQGFVTFGKGHRAGFCGTAVVNNDKITALRDIDSVNIRISRFVDDAADDLINKVVKTKNFNGIIVAGAPCSGKTTILKSFAAKVSSSYDCGYMKTVLIDERREMGDCCGINCDVIRGMSKSDGITHAIRTLSPEIIICDEIATIEDAEKIIRCCYSGVKFVVSVHIGHEMDLFTRSVSKKIAECGFFNHVAILDDSSKPGKIMKIAKLEEIKNEFNCSNGSNNKLICNSISYYTQRNQALSGA